MLRLDGSERQIFALARPLIDVCTSSVDAQIERAIVAIVAVRTAAFVAQIATVHTLYVSSGT